MNESIIAQILETLNRIEAKVDDNAKDALQRLDQHMRDEEAEILGFADSLAALEAKSDKQHATLIQSIESYMDKSIEIETAFLTHEGKPDLLGHRDDHYTRKTIRDWVVNSAGSGFKKVFEYGIMAGVLWLGYEIWIAILRGPK